MNYAECSGNLDVSEFVVVYPSKYPLLRLGTKTEKEEVKVIRWYFGGIATAMAACFTHPLDLLKVQMQTQKGKNISIFQLASTIIKQQGVRGLYTGISASISRQLTYSTARFAIYEAGRPLLIKQDAKQMTVAMSALIAGIGGFVGGFVGTPSDVVNVRMQNDIKLPPEQRRNYKNVLDGMYQVASKEGVTRLWAGGSLNCPRAALMTIGQITFYEKFKSLFLSTPWFGEDVVTHIAASICAGAVAVTLTQPVDVLKTRAMNAKEGEVKSIVGLVFSTLKEGPLALFKGYVPAFVRLAPHTILTFVFLEQLRMRFGIVQSSKGK